MPWKKNVPVYRSDRRTSKIVHMVVDFLDAVLAPEETIHANVLHVFNVGILIRERAALVRVSLPWSSSNGDIFMVSDDVTVLRKIGESRLIGYAPRAVRNLMELLGDRHHRREADVRHDCSTGILRHRPLY